MSYKDKEKQRQAVRNATRRYRANLRAKLKGITPVSLNDGITQDGDTPVGDTPPDYQHQPHCNAPRFAKPFTKGVCCSCRQVVIEQPKEQNHNPMMVGYVPPRQA